MSVCKYTNKELVDIAHMKMNQLHHALKNCNVYQAMGLRKELQKGMDQYSKVKNKDKRVMEKLVSITSKIEKWCRLAFFKNKLPYGPLHTYAEKTRVRLEWEDYVKRNSY